MLAASIPTKFPIPWGNSAGSSFIRPIPVASQIGIIPGAASLTDGFPPENFLPEGAGGVPPFGQDENGILNEITQWTQWYSAGGPIPYDPTFQSAIGGYPAGAVIQSAVTVGLFFLSTADNNATNPDTGGAGWVSYSPGNSNSRVITASGAFTTNLSDNSIGLNRTTSIATSATTLPTGSPNGKRIRYSDLVGNFNAFPVTISAPGGQTIAGSATATLNVNGQVAELEFFSTASIWSLRL